MSPPRISPTASGQFEPQLISISDQPGETPRWRWDGSRFLVAWEDLRGATSDIRATRVTATGVVQDPVGLLVSGAPGAQSEAAVAARPGGFLVAWQDGRTGYADVRAARVTDAGGLPDAGGIVVAGGAGEQGSPAAVWNGSRFLVGWEAATDIRGPGVGGRGRGRPVGVPVSGAPGAQTTPGGGETWVEGDRRLDRRPNSSRGQRHLRGPGVRAARCHLPVVG